MQSDYSVVYSGVSDSDSVPLPSIRVFLDPTFLLLLVPTCVMAYRLGRRLANLLPLAEWTINKTFTSEPIFFLTYIYCFLTLSEAQSRFGDKLLGI